MSSYDAVEVNGKYSQRQHLLFSTLACLATLVPLVIFRGRMPAEVPLQMQAGGVGGNLVPRDAMVFGFPVLMALVNLYRGFFLIRSKGVRPNSYYLVPVCAFILAVTLIVFALKLQ